LAGDTPRGAHRTRTSRAGRFRTTAAVPVPFQCFSTTWTVRWTVGLGPSNTVKVRPSRPLRRLDGNLFKPQKIIFTDSVSSPPHFSQESPSHLLHCSPAPLRPRLHSLNLMLDHHRHRVPPSLRSLPKRPRSMNTYAVLLPHNLWKQGTDAPHTFVCRKPFTLMDGHHVRGLYPWLLPSPRVLNLLPFL
jgi:hypothetical protein